MGGRYRWLGLVVCLWLTACAAPPARTDIQVVRLTLPDTGVYRLRAADLAAQGVDWSAVDPRNLGLFFRQQPVPFAVLQSGPRWEIAFWNRESPGDYAPQVVFWLTREGGGQQARPLQVTPADEANLAEVTTAVHLEEDREYFPTVETGSPWMWLRLTAPQTTTVRFSLPTASLGAQGQMSLAVWGRSQSFDVSPDHRLRVTLNQHPVADFSWDGRGRHLLSTEIDARWLLPGENALRLEAPGDTGAAVDAFLLDWMTITVTLPAKLNAPLTFVSRAANPTLRLERPATLWALRPDGEMAFYLARQPETIQVSEPEGARWMVWPLEQFASPTIAPATTDPDLRAIQPGADYVVIGPQALLDAARPLLAWRQQQGLRVQAVPLQAVYDQFNRGMPEPEAIRAFLRLAATRWEVPPRYVLLLGDDSYALRGADRQADAFFLPAFHTYTFFGGWTVTDVPFSRLDGDDLPDLAVGRMPARSPEEVGRLVDKILRYERTRRSAEALQVLAVADASEPRFEQDARSFLTLFPASVSTRLSLGPSAEEVAARWGESALVVYFGHGSLIQWGREDYLTVDGVARLQHGATAPLVFHLTCLTGMFAHPTRETLVERLLWQPDGGAVASLAPTSLTLPDDQRFLSDALVAAWVAGAPRLGDLWLQAWRRVSPTQSGVREVMETFLLFGDPALQLPPLNPGQ